MNLKDINNSFARQLYFETNRYSEFINEMYLDEHKKLGVGWMALTHGHILLSLYAIGEMTMTEITNQIRRKAPTTTILVKKLKKEGYVSSKISTDDNRISLIVLTEKGKEHCEKMEKFLSDFAEAGEKAVTVEEVETVTRILKKIRGNIQLELKKD